MCGLSFLLSFSPLESLRLYDDTDFPARACTHPPWCAGSDGPCCRLDHLRHLGQTFETVDLWQSFTFIQENLKLRVITTP